MSVIGLNSPAFCLEEMDFKFTNALSSELKYKILTVEISMLGLVVSNRQSNERKIFSTNDARTQQGGMSN